MTARSLFVAFVLSFAACTDTSARPAPAPAPPRPTPPPVVAPAPLPRPPRVLTIAATQPRRHLMVLLHGVGSNADNMMPVARALAPMLPDADVLVPDGLDPWSGGPGAREWYSLQNITDAERSARVEPAGRALSAWLDEELASRSLDGSKLIVVGFSQGAGLAEWLVVRRPTAPVAIALSGRFYVDGDNKAAAGARALVVHGTDDRVVPISYGEASRKGLEARGVEVQWVSLPGLGHHIDDRVIAAVRDYLMTVTSK